jgi:chitin deacetylase
MHTWTHRYMSSLDNQALVADFGWAMQIIHDSTGGRVPRYWRPPYGDADNRVRAIAKEIFGLTTVVWNQDSQDWTMASGGTTLPAIQQAFTGWLNGPRSPGLIVLEHEITPDDVTAFMNMYPLIAAAQGGAPWVVTSVAGLFDGHATGWNGNSWYQNSDNDTSPVNDQDILVSNSTSTAPSGTTTGTASHTGTATATTRNAAEKNLGSISGVGIGVAVLAGVLSLAL